MDTDSESNFSDRPPVDIFVEEGELSDQDPDATVTDPDQTLSEEQNYRETMRGIRSYKLVAHPRYGHYYLFSRRQPICRSEITTVWQGLCLHAL